MADVSANPRWSWTSGSASVECVPRIRVISPDEATGLLEKQYEEAMRRAGRIWNVVSIMSQNARALRASMALYTSLMQGQSPLSRRQREMIAVVVSARNDCVY